MVFGNKSKTSKSKMIRSAPRRSATDASEKPAVRLSKVGSFNHKGSADSNDSLTTLTTLTRTTTKASVFSPSNLVDADVEAEDEEDEDDDHRSRSSTQSLMMRDSIDGLLDLWDDFADFDDAESMATPLEGQQKMEEAPKITLAKGFSAWGAASSTSKLKSHESDDSMSVLSRASGSSSSLLNRMSLSSVGRSSNGSGGKKNRRSRKPTATHGSISAPNIDTMPRSLVAENPLFRSQESRTAWLRVSIPSGELVPGRRCRFLIPNELMKQLSKSADGDDGAWQRDVEGTLQDRLFALRCAPLDAQPAAAAAHPGYNRPSGKSFRGKSMSSMSLGGGTKEYFDAADWDEKHPNSCSRRFCVSVRIPPATSRPQARSALVAVQLPSYSRRAHLVLATQSARAKRKLCELREVYDFKKFSKDDLISELLAWEDRVEFNMSMDELLELGQEHDLDGFEDDTRREEMVNVLLDLGVESLEVEASRLVPQDVAELCLRKLACEFETETQLKRAAKKIGISWRSVQTNAKRHEALFRLLV